MFPPLLILSWLFSSLSLSFRLPLPPSSIRWHRRHWWPKPWPPSFPLPSLSSHSWIQTKTLAGIEKSESSSPNWNLRHRHLSGNRSNLCACGVAANVHRVAETPPPPKIYGEKPPICNSQSCLQKISADSNNTVAKPPTQRGGGELKRDGATDRKAENNTNIYISPFIDDNFYCIAAPEGNLPYIGTSRLKP